MVFIGLLAGAISGHQHTECANIWNSAQPRGVTDEGTMNVIVAPAVAVD